MKTKQLIIAAACALGLVACTEAQQTTARTAIDTGHTLCQVVVAATDPKLAPLCSTAADVANAVNALVKAHHDAAVATGIRGSIEPYTPSNDEVYQFLAQQGAQPADR